MERENYKRHQRLGDSTIPENLYRLDTFDVLHHNYLSSDVNLIDIRTYISCMTVINTKATYPEVFLRGSCPFQGCVAHWTITKKYQYKLRSVNKLCHISL